jgi:hypothetical protein
VLAANVPSLRNTFAAAGPQLLMIFLNGLWTLTDLVYIPLLGLSEIDFYAKVVVNAFLAIGLAPAGRRAGLL